MRIHNVRVNRRLDDLVRYAETTSELATSGQRPHLRDISLVSGNEFSAPNLDLTNSTRLKDFSRITRLYETLLSTTNDFAYIFDPQGRFLYANASLLKVYARTLDQVVGRNFHELGYPSWHAEMHLKEIRDIVRTKKPFRGEIPFTGDSGIYGIYDYIFQPVLDSAGEVEFIVGTTRDVTARKQAEEKVEIARQEKGENELRYRFLADSIPQIAWTAKPDGNLDYYNQRWFEYAGTDPETMAKVGWTFYVHPDDLPKAGQVWQKSLETGCNYEVEFRLLRASDQSYRWHLVRAFPMKNEKGEVLQWAGTCTDIDDQRQLTEKLAEAADKLSRIAAVVEYSDDAIISKSLDGIIKSWNAGAERVFGYKAEEIIGKSILLLIPPELQKEEPVIIEKLKKGERIEHFETVRVTKDGLRMDISLTVSPIKDQSGKVIGASKIARDITEEKKRQEATRESEARFRSELERLVGERTVSLQEAVTQMEEFSYSVSHDLRAPLRAMQGYATALLEDYQGKIEGDGQEYLQHIVNAANRMDRLTRDVLVYSKIPRTEFKLRAVDLDTLVSDIVRQNLPDRAKGATIDIQKPLLSVLGNESFLTQTISNLIDNAVKFASKERPLRIRIWTERHQEMVRLCVEDNGIGVLPEHQARVWGMFERIHPQHLYQGTGIGLAIVRKTVERMSGTMGLESDGSTGSKFWIQLPRADQIPPHET